MSWSTSELRVRLAPLNRFKPSSKIFYWPFQGGTSFVDLLCFVLSYVCYVLCVSVYMCFVVTCWERADLLALVCGVFCEFVTFPLVSWVRCGTWLYRFLIFAPLLTFNTFIYITSRPNVIIIMPFIINLQTIHLIQPIFRLKNTKSCITLLTWYFSLWPSSMFIPPIRSI